MAFAYYPQLSVALIDTEGYLYSFPGADINVYNMTTATTGTDLTTDDDGVIAEGAMTGSAGDVVELSHVNYPLTMRLTLQVDQETAYTAVENDVTTFIVDNQYAGTTDATSADIYIVDPDEPGSRRRIGSGKTGEDVLIPYESSIAKTMRVFTVAKADSFVKTEDAFLDEKAATVYISPTRSANRLIFEHFTNATTAGTGKETLYSDTIDAGTWAVNGDLIECEYAGESAMSIAAKTIVLDIAGSEVASLTVPNTDDDWSIECEIMRQSNTVLRVTATLSYGTAGAVSVLVGDITGLDLAATDYDILLRAVTPGGADDITATMGNGKFWGGTDETIFMIGGVDFTIDSSTMTV